MTFFHFCYRRRVPPVSLTVKSETRRITKLPRVELVIVSRESGALLCDCGNSPGGLYGDYCTGLLRLSPKYVTFKDICPSSLIFCLRQLTALTHHMGHRFSLTSAHSTQRGFCCVINVKSCIICSQSLVLGTTYQGLSTSFQISLCNPLPSSIPVNPFLFSHILPMHSFLLPFILRLLYFIHFVLLWVHSL